MRSRPEQQRSRTRRRRGLAPLEFVAALPIIITIAALMYVVGAAGLVKSRSQAVARYANWRTSSIRNGGGDPRPRNWSNPAVLFASGGAPLDGANSLWANSRLTAGSIGGPVANDMDFDFRVGNDVHTGNAEYRQAVPMMEQVTGRDRFDLRLEQHVLADPWEYHEGPFALPTNQTSFSRIGGPLPRYQIEIRGDRWYEFSQDDAIFPTMDFAKSELVAAGLDDLDPLDNDPELIAHHGYPPRDFHPRYRGWWGSPAATLVEASFENHLERVAEVPGVMAEEFLRMYNSQIDELQRQRDALAAQMPPDVAAIAAIDAQIQALEAKAGPMQRFLDALPPQNKP